MGRISAQERRESVIRAAIARRVGGWMRIWETVHLSLGADADRTAGFFACGILGTTLAAMRLRPNAGR